MTGQLREVALGDAEYPARFVPLPEPPARIWLAGALPAGAAVAIVGTRRADPDACDFARRLAAELGRAGVAIVSGGAAGIDAAAHRGALDAEAPTVVVQAAALTDLYPRSHRALFAEILERGGAWIGETPPGRAAHPGRFLARNRLIAALADAVVVVQAPRRSGALSTARWARAIGRPLFAVPGVPWDPRAEGSVALLAAGARPCVEAADVASTLGVLVHRAPPARARRPSLPPEQRAVARASTAGWTA